MRTATGRRTFLPIDPPPSNRVVIGAVASNFVGIHQSGSLGQIDVPLYTRPWAPWQSAAFPSVQGSSAGVTPNVIRPSWWVAVMKYSPITHRNPLTNFRPPRALPARGVGVPTQRPRGYAPGYVTRWPMPAPQWPSFAESPNALETGN